MRAASSRIALSLLLCALHARAEAPRGVGAGTSSAPSTPRLALVDTLTGDAKASQQQGKALYDRGDWAGARGQFQMVYAASSDARMLWNVALAEKGLKHPATALTFVQRFIKERGKAMTLQERKDADELRKTLETQSSKLKLSVSEPDADVFIDDQLAGSTPIPTPIAVDPGTKRIRVKKNGFKETVETETFTNGGTVVLEIVLQPDLHQGRLHVNAAPNDTIWLDGRVVGQGKWDALVTSGRHYVSVTAPGKRSYETETTVRDAEVRDLDVTLQVDDSGRGDGATALWIAGGAALVAGAVIGGYFLFRSSPSGTEPVPSTFGTIQLPLGAR